MSIVKVNPNNYLIFKSPRSKIMALDWVYSPSFKGVSDSNMFTSLIKSISTQKCSNEEEMSAAIHKIRYFFEARFFQAEYKRNSTKSIWLSMEDVDIINSIDIDNTKEFNLAVPDVVKTGLVVNSPKGNMMPSFFVKEALNSDIYGEDNGEVNERKIAIDFNFQGADHGSLIMPFNDLGDALFFNDEKLMEVNLSDEDSIIVEKQSKEVMGFVARLFIFLMLDETSLKKALMVSNGRDGKVKNFTIKIKESLKIKRDASLHVVKTFVRQLKDPKYYQGEWENKPVGSRFVVVKEHLRGVDRNVVANNE